MGTVRGSGTSGATISRSEQALGIRATSAADATVPKDSGRQYGRSGYRRAGQFSYGLGPRLGHALYDDGVWTAGVGDHTEDNLHLDRLARSPSPGVHRRT